MICSYGKNNNKISPKKVGKGTWQTQGITVFETDHSYNEGDLCNLIILIHYLIGCSRQNREESKEKILVKKRETYLWILPFNTMKEYIFINLEEYIIS